MTADELLATLEAELDDITRLLDAYGDAPSLLRMQARIVGALLALREQWSTTP